METEFTDIVALILNYNSSNLTISCVDQLLMLSKELKILIVDNHSTDQSCQSIISKYVNINQVVVIQTPKNLGYAKGNNYGLCYIRKEWIDVKYVMLLNPDIIVKEREIILNIKNFLNENDAYSIASTQIIFNNAWRGFKDFAWKLPTKKQLMWAGTFFGKVLLKEINNCYSEIYLNNNIADVDAVPGCFFVAKIKDLETVGDFDDRTFLYFEETILASKLKNINKKEAVLIDQYVLHNHRTKDKSLANYKTKLFDRKCFYESKMVYVNNYSGEKGVFIILCRIVNYFDFALKKMIYGLASILQR